MYILCQEIDSAIPIRLNFIIVSRITPSGAHVSSYMGWGIHSGLLQNVRQDMVKKYRKFLEDDIRQEVVRIHELACREMTIQFEGLNCKTCCIFKRRFQTAALLPVDGVGAAV